MTTPIVKLIMGSVKCVRCNLGLQECLDSNICMERCECGWFKEINGWCNNPIHKYSIDVCKNCNKTRGDHRANTHACPVGKEGRAGYTSYFDTKVFEFKRRSTKKFQTV